MVEFSTAITDPLEALIPNPVARRQGETGMNSRIDENALRAAVLGANDGLVSNLSLVMGVAGAEIAGQTILLTGLAGLIAGACSMAIGEWLSVTESRELAKKRIDNEIVGLPWAAAASSFLLFSAGAIFPVVPFFWIGGNIAAIYSVLLSAVALCLLGMGTSPFTGRSFVFSASRQLVGGLIAAAITYGVGRLIGVAVN